MARDSHKPHLTKDCGHYNTDLDQLREYLSTPPCPEILSRVPITPTRLDRTHSLPSPTTSFMSFKAIVVFYDWRRRVPTSTKITLALRRGAVLLDETPGARAGEVRAKAKDI